MVLNCIVQVLVLDLAVMATMSYSSYTREIHEQDYCAGDLVEPTCGQNEVIVAMNATYGRMRTNDCVLANVGYLGCGTNVLDVIDKHCSGRQHCSMMVPNDDLNAHNSDNGCFSELVKYLQASYTCEKVYPVPQGVCGRPITVSVTSQGGYISSLSPHESACNYRDTMSWMLEAQPGQHINLTLFDFKLSTDPHRLVSCPLTYGHIVDQSTNEKFAICGGRERISSLKNFAGKDAHQLQIVIKTRPDSVDPYNFLIHYKAVGCPDLVPPKKAWLKRSFGSEEAIIGCDETRQQWHLKCVDNGWQGVIGNCTHSAAAMQASQQAASRFTIPHGFVIFLIIAIAVVISGCIIIVGIVILKRYRVNSMKGILLTKPLPGQIYEEPKYKVKIPVYDAHSNPAQLQQRNEYTHIWEYPLPEPSAHAPERPISNENESRDIQPFHSSHVQSDCTELDHLRRYYALDKDTSQDASSLVTTVIT